MRWCSDSRNDLRAGIEVLHAETFDFHCFQTLTGTKFMMVTEPNTPEVDELLRTL